MLVGIRAETPEAMRNGHSGVGPATSVCRLTGKDT